MLLESLQKRLAYHEWAWQQIFDSIKQLDEAEYKKDRGYFWGSMHGMLVHGMAAEVIWLSRSKGVSPKTLLDPDDYPDLSSVLSHWEIVAVDLREFIHSITLDDLARTVEYRSTEGDIKQLNQLDIIQQVLNHATEHRSQLTPTLFNLGVPTCWMDYMYFCLLDV